MNPETFKPIAVEFIGGPLCGRQQVLPSNSSRYTCMGTTDDGSLARHVYLRGDSLLENGCYPMRWVPPRAKA